MNGHNRYAEGTVKAWFSFKKLYDQFDKKHAQQLGKDPAMVSKWCTNTAQPSLETLSEIVMSLEVDVKDLLQLVVVR